MIPAFLERYTAPLQPNGVVRLFGFLYGSQALANLARQHAGRTVEVLADHRDLSTVFVTPPGGTKVVRAACTAPEHARGAALSVRRRRVKSERARARRAFSSFERADLHFPASFARERAGFSLSNYH
jgi:hypothetical protein